jgi:hypothetical protein
MVSETKATRTPQQVIAQQKADANREWAKAGEGNLPVSTALLANNLNGPPRDRVDQGRRIKSIDGLWTVDGQPVPSPLLAVSTTTCLQRFPKDGGPPEVIPQRAGENLPDVAELNAKIPQSEWQPGLDGKPRPPWAKFWVAHLLDPRTAEIYTFSNSTVGARLAVERLEERVQRMRSLRGENVVPLVELGSAPMKTQFSPTPKKRPEFAIKSWHANGGTPVASSPAKQIEHQASENIGRKVEEPTVREELNDSIPF